MARDYAALSRDARGIHIPRRLALVAGGLLLAMLAYVVFAPPRWTIQRLESPDGQRTALLQRARFGQQHFVVKVGDGILWRTLYLSPAITNSFRDDLGERLAWSSNSATLFFRMQGQVIWQHGF